MTRTQPIYGSPPIVVGSIQIDPCESLFCLYLPIKLPNSSLNIPSTYRQFNKIIDAVREDVLPHKWTKSYVYLTAKHIWVEEGAPGNRPGWHADGFLTNDLNYVWYDMNPTEFWEPEFRRAFTADHNLSLPEMEEAANAHNSVIRTYPNKSLLLLDQTVIHRVNPAPKAGFRTFVKVSVSNQIYALKRNSINHMFDTDWTYQERTAERNNPAGVSNGT